MSINDEFILIDDNITPSLTQQPTNHFILSEQSFWKCVLSHIHSHKTWYDFALVCKFFSELCRNESTQRKLEFRISVTERLKGETNLNIHIFAPSRFSDPIILPNGTLHGQIKCGEDGYDDNNYGHILDVDTGYVRGIIDIVNNRREKKVIHIFGKCFLYAMFYLVQMTNMEEEL